MTNSRPFIPASLMGLLILISATLSACSPAGTVQTATSTLPGLIAYCSDLSGTTVHVYTMKPDGSDNVTTGTDVRIIDSLPRWSPDGAKIAFCSDQSGKLEIWTMKEDGSDRKQITDTKENNFSPRWSPDGSRIVFVGYRKNTAGDPMLEIFMVNASGGEVKRLTDSSTWENFTSENTTVGDEETRAMRWNSVPTWSPDGSRILFSSNRDGDNTVPILYTMNPDGSDQKKFGLIFPVVGSEPDWSPVTNKLVVVRGNAVRGEIWVMDAGFPFPQFTAKKLTDNFDNNRSPVWSPDGRQIAFVSNTYGNDDIFVMNADGSNVRRLTYETSNEYHPSWR